MAAQGRPGVGVVHARVCGPEAEGPLKRLTETLPDSTWHSSTPQRARGHGGGYVQRLYMNI